MIELRNKHLINSCVMIAGLLMVAWNRSIHAALPPAKSASQSQESETSAPAQPDNSVDKSVPRTQTPERETIFALPPVRIGGKITYEVRSDANDDQKIVQQGITSTLTARTNTYLWEPWFATLNGELGVSVLRYRTTSSQSGANLNGVGMESLTSKNLLTTGNLQLNLIPRSKYPFEGHVNKTDSRMSGTLSALTGFSSTNYGFSQSFVSPLGQGMVGFDRSEQTGGSGTETRQDSMRLSLTKALTPKQNLQVNGNRSDNTLKTTGERATQTNLSFQHKYLPTQALTIDSIANVSKAGYQLMQGNTDTDLLQLSSFGFWRPPEGGMMVTGGVRLLTLANHSSSMQAADGGSGSRMQNANANLGVTYDFSRTVRMNAGANFNTTMGFGQRSTEGSQSVGVIYQPETKLLGDFRYDWSTGATFNNITSTSNKQQEERQLTLQLSHSLGRSTQLSSGSALSMSVGQSISSLVRSNGGATQQLTHTGTLAWNLARQEGSTYVSVSASDSRAMGDRNESFQMVNLQVSSSIPTGRFTFWSGNLTVQAVNQHTAVQQFGQNPSGFMTSRSGVVTTSTGSISYQNLRLFGIPRLRFLSDLRLNSQALLPVLGGPQDQETAAWENNLDYQIGRTQFRMSGRLSQSGGRNNKSIMFTATRGLGDF